MFRFWTLLLEPLLDVAAPKTIVEIGSDYGNTTRPLLKYCHRQNAHLHVIDPLPQYNTELLEREFGPQVTFHVALSLDVLPGLEAYDLVLIDGDHNWYTVFNELKRIEQHCISRSCPFPLILFHDVGWPYGRRDQYCEPTRIPDEFRQPYQQKGVVLHTSALVENGGLNAHKYHAESENGPRNGVLTAIEDFMRERDRPLHFIKLPAYHGLGIMFDDTLESRNPELARFIETLRLSPAITQIITQLEEQNITLIMAHKALSDELNEIKTKNGSALQRLILPKLAQIKKKIFS